MTDAEHDREQREHKSIVFADVAGYSRLMQEDEVATQRYPGAYRGI